MKHVYCLAILLFAYAFQLESVETSIQYFDADNIPEMLNMYAGQGDLTMITITDLPKNSKITVTESGFMRTSRTVFKDKQIPHGQILYVVGAIGYFPGAAVTYTFIDKKNKLNEEISIIPWKLLAKSNIDKAEIEAEVISAYPSAYKITFTGFDPTEEVVFKSKSYDEIIETPTKQRTMFVTTGVNGKKGGVAEISVTRASGEVLELELPWGFEWMKYILEAQPDGTGKAVSDDPKFLKANPELAEYFKSRSR